MAALRPRFLRLAFAALLLPLAAAARSFAQPDPAPAPQLAEATADALGKLRDLTTAQAYPAALTLLDQLLAATPADSYDTALLSQIKAQVLLQQSRYTEAIAPLERAFRLGEARAYFPAASQTDTAFLLAQLYQQASTETKVPADQRARLASSADYLRRRLSLSPRTTPEIQLFAASLYYQQATLDAEKPDLAKLRESRRAAEIGLALQLRPSNSLYVLILAALQQTSDYSGSADLLEFLVDKNPANSGYWQQLVGTYLTLAASAPHAPEARRYNLRALLALERAQARGLLATPRENFNRVALYLALAQPDSALAILEKGLADGTIENTRRNWELLANTYQQNQRETEAIAALQKAAAAFPSDGQLEFLLAQLLYGRSRPADARRHLERAIAKGSLDHPGQTRLFLAYISFETQSYDEAGRWARETAAFDDVKKDDLARLEKAIAEALRNRSAATTAK